MQHEIIFSKQYGDCRYQAAVNGGFFVAEKNNAGQEQPPPNRRPKAEDRQNKNTRARHDLTVKRHNPKTLKT
ncbi:hypothetical protein GGR30_004680 [Martelella radicis]|uniref:Uncharacterized protein n=1 Tax=Martelella radicis TaxID=1397476 RepID=A0A7W6PC92_9HYPH|nr:hypothetical protein [Martelella radicis]